jgi:hypothetical protein
LQIHGVLQGRVCTSSISCKVYFAIRPSICILEAAAVQCRAGVTRAIDEIDAFLRTTDQVGYDNSGGGVLVIGTHLRGSETDASQRAHVVEKILDWVLPGLRKDRPSKDSEYRWLRDQASRAKAAPARSTELAIKLGDDAPDMDAANLHPWALENGRSYGTQATTTKR